jgi:hypothetical protein
VIGFYALAEFVHNTAVRFHIFVIQSQHARRKHTTENGCLLDNNHRFIGAGCGDGCGDSGRSTTDDNYIVVTFLGCIQFAYSGKQETDNRQ